MFVMREQWRPLVNPEVAVKDLYEVSDHGRVRTNWFKGEKRELRQIQNEDGHRRVGLHTKEKGSRLFFVHRLVAFAFPERVKGEYSEETPILHHTSGIPYLNLPEFLEWTTNRQNLKYHFESDDYAMNYISDAKVIEIIERYYRNPRIRQDNLVKEYDTSMVNIHNYIWGKSRDDILDKFLEIEGITKEQYAFRVSGDELRYEMFSMHHEKGMSQAAIAKELGCGQGIVSMILNGKRRPHLKEMYWRGKNPLSPF